MTPDLIKQDSDFDYAALEPALADDARAAAARIRARMRDSIIETGRDLLAMKVKLQHGQFVAWLEGALDLNIRSAERYMAATRFANEKGDTVSLLPTTALHILAAPSVPERAKETAIARLQNGEHVTADEARTLVRCVREADRRAKRTPEQVTQECERERRREAREASNRKRQKEEFERDELAQQDKAMIVGKFLVQRLGAAGVRKLTDLMHGTDWYRVKALFVTNLNYPLPTEDIERKFADEVTHPEGGRA